MNAAKALPCRGAKGRGNMVKAAIQRLPRRYHNEPCIGQNKNQMHPDQRQPAAIQTKPAKTDLHTQQKADLRDKKWHKNTTEQPAVSKIFGRCGI